jgi:hypothetical protein
VDLLFLILFHICSVIHEVHVAVTEITSSRFDDRRGLCLTHTETILIEEAMCKSVTQIPVYELIIHDANVGRHSKSN